jgi:hypothetical protein
MWRDGGESLEIYAAERCLKIIYFWRAAFTAHIAALPKHDLQVQLRAALRFLVSTTTLAGGYLV